MHRRLFHINAFLTSLSHLTHPSPELGVRKETWNFHLASSPAQVSTSQQNGNHPGVEQSDLRASPGPHHPGTATLPKSHSVPWAIVSLSTKETYTSLFYLLTGIGGKINTIMNKQAPELSKVWHTRINVIINMSVLAIMSKHLIS